MKELKAKFKCPECGKILIRDMMDVLQMSFLTTHGNYRSVCDKSGNDVVCRRVKG
jgi:predicted RNA-binding Zn-ribbon protein involved in translation (DUF1610 family)